MLQYVRNNRDAAIFIPFGDVMVQFAPRGNGDTPLVNSIDPGLLSKITGGFDAKGKAKGGAGHTYFDGVRPSLQRVPKPPDTDEVNAIESVPGVRPSKRTQLRREKANEISDLKLQVATLTAMIMSGKVPAKAEPLFDPGDHNVSDLAGQLEGMSSAELVEVLGLEVDGKNRSTAIETITEAITG